MPQGRVRCLNAEVAVTVRSRWWHQLGNAINQLQRRECELIDLGTAFVVEVAAGIAVLLGAAVNQLAARFAQPLHGKRRSGAVAQQTLQPGAVVRCNAYAGVHREAAVHVAQHLLGLETLQQTAPHKGTQDALTQAGLRLGYGLRSHAGGQKKYHRSREFS